VSFEDHDHSKAVPTACTGETRSVPVLPLRDVVAFPHLVVLLFVGRQKSIRALEEAVRLDTSFC
jgi:ATP-dependent Lon protease